VSLLARGDSAAVRADRLALFLKLQQIPPDGHFRDPELLRDFGDGYKTLSLNDIAQDRPARGRRPTDRVGRAGEGRGSAP
jgi:hypothetical protein